MIYFKKRKKVIHSEGGFPTTKHIDNSLHSGIRVLTKRQMSECVLALRLKKVSSDSCPVRRIYVLKHVIKALIFKCLV